MQQMDIVHVIFQMMTGGIETMLVDIMNEQLSRGHRVELLIVNRGENADVMAGIDPRVRITRFNRTPGANPLLLMGRLNTWMLRRRPDIIHLHMQKLTGLLRVMRRRAVFTVHDLNIPMAYAARYNMAAISRSVAEDVSNRVSGGRVTVVCNGINTSTIAHRPDVAIGEPVRIVQVSRLLSEKKGQDILIEAAKILRDRGINVALTFIGEGPDLEALQTQAEGLDVTFTGNMPRKEIYARLKEFDIMCHPARYDGFGLTVAEGMTAGLPVVVPEGGGPWEVADRGRLAEVFKSGDASECAAAIERIIGNYDAALERVAEGREYVEAHFSVKRMVSEYDALYQKII